MSRINIWLYRKTGGRLFGTMAGAPILLLTTIGRKSGLLRTKPVLYLQDGEDLIVVASVAGQKQHPMWFRNLQANPRVSVEVGRRRTERLARIASDEERASLWPRLVVMYPAFDLYQSWTERRIQVVVLSNET
jgi:deazaflavin-dependent oxidoreductase (nitroreductase family)